MDFVCCGPEGFEPDFDTVKMVEDSASSSFQLSHDPISAVRDADVILITVGTPLSKDGSADKSAIKSAVNSIWRAQLGFTYRFSL